jgi:hypothetical protein
MLMQSWGGKIRIFPAWPSDWKDACFYNLRAQGAFLVSAVKRAGVTRFISIKSIAGEPCTIKCDLKGKIKLLASKTVKMQQDGELITLKLPKGEEAILYTGIKPESFEIVSLPTSAEKCNSWGITGK